MKPFIEQAQLYSEYHQNALTRYTHSVGIPLIILSLMILLGFVHIVIPGVLDINVADVATLGLLVFFFLLEWHLALALTPLLIILLWIAQFFSYGGPTSFSLWAFIIIFVIGCTLQITGHILEGKRPALIDNVWLALVAPMFMIAEVFFMAGRMQALKEEMYPRKSR